MYMSVRQQGREETCYPVDIPDIRLPDMMYRVTFVKLYLDNVREIFI